MLPVIPTLTIDGWDVNPLSQMSKLLEYYQASDYSQSNTFINNITSLKYTLQLSSNVNILKNNIITDLRNLYGSYFDTVEPVIEIKEADNGVLNIYIDVKCTRQGQEFKLSRAISGRFSGIIDYETKLVEKYKYDVREK